MGVRLAFRGVPVIVFKLKTAINVDEMIELQHFEFSRKSTRNGKSHTDVIGCKIKGLRVQNRQENAHQHGESDHYPVQDDRTRELRIFGCEYRVPKQTLVEVLSY